MVKLRKVNLKGTKTVLVMLKISKLADYAVLIVVELSRSKDISLSATQVSEATGLQLPTVRKILKLLARASVLDAKRGADGGYILNRPPEHMNVLEIIEAMDGTMAITECCDQRGHCEVAGCHMKPFWSQVNQHIRNTLRQLILSDVLNRRDQTILKMMETKG